MRAVDSENIDPGFNQFSYTPWSSDGWSVGSDDFGLFHIFSIYHIRIQNQQQKWRAGTDSLGPKTRRQILKQYEAQVR
jgi:hypothetical protein